MNNPPKAAIWLTVPDDCWLAGEFEVSDHDTPNIQFSLGSNGNDVHLLFEREALERFIELAQRMLDLPQPEENARAIPDMRLVAHHGYEIREVNKFAKCGVRAPCW